MLCSTRSRRHFATSNGARSARWLSSRGCTIARNRCLSTLRSRGEQSALDFDLPTEGLTEQLERRAELRDLLRDLRELPEAQRAALLLTEAGDLSHAEVAHGLGWDVANVKALVFRARSGLIEPSGCA
jgi:DNA-directed RNA polymerase specialized sigma24 family protein